MAQGIERSANAKPQTVCIDLPGESVQCWRSTDKVQVILKKHRDVIFELSLAQEKKYTVESTGSDFYNANKKKIVAGGGKERILFADGERLHLWISRDFKGEFLLKSAGQLLMRIDPAKLDARRYDNDPKTKPMPIVVGIGSPLRKTPSDTVQTQKFNDGKSMGLPANLRPAAAPIDEECAAVCVVEGDAKGMPARIWDKLKSGGGADTGLVEVDPNDIATRNWLLGQIASAGAYVGDNWSWLKSSVEGKADTGFKLVKARIHYVKGKARYYFSGYTRYNTIFRNGGFGPGNDRVLSIFSGAGKASSSLASAAANIAGTFKNNALVAFIFGNVTSLAEWKSDITKDGYDLSAALLMNLIKSIIIAALTSLIVAFLVCVAMFAFKVSGCIVAVGIATMAAGVAVSYGVAWADKELGRIVGGKENNDGLSAVWAKQMRENVEKNHNFLRGRKFWDKEDWIEKSRFN
jgi:hypothetical protein